MSNHKRAYGWVGHTLVSANDFESQPDHNIVAVAPDKFDRIVKDYKQHTLDSRIQAEQLGIEDAELVFLATGVGFSEGWNYYSTIFTEAEIRCEHGVSAVDWDKEYLAAMLEIYDIDLPPCKIMIGCSAEH